jgi:RNA polymerase sigma factor (sigma-70 family)
VREEQPDLFVRRRLYRDAVVSWRHRPPDQLLESPEWLEPDEPWDADVVERRREVLRALRALTPRQRAVVVLRWFEERDEHDVADVIGCSVSTAHSEGIEALGRLRDALPRADLGAGGVR